MARKLRSIFTQDLEHCYFTGKEGAEIHHVFFGNPYYRIHAEEDGYLIPLCREFHTGNVGIHKNHELDVATKQFCQSDFEETHTREEFIQRYGKSYL